MKNISNYYSTKSKIPAITSEYKLGDFCIVMKYKKQKGVLSLPELNFFQTIGSILSIALIDLVLSGDNAAVIGLAICRLPHYMRKSAAALGALGAIILRLLFTLMATELLKIPFLTAIGGFFLLLIAYKLIKQQEDNKSEIKAASSFWQAIAIIILADLSMAFDNVLGVAGAAHGNFHFVVFGLFLSIPILVWGSTFLADLMNRYPIIIYIGGGVLVHTAITMILRDQALNIAGLLPGIGAGSIGWLAAISIIVYGGFKTKTFFRL